MLLSLKPCHICFPSVYFSERAALVQCDMPFCCHGIYTSKCARNQICKWRCHFCHTSRSCIYLFHVIFCGRSSSMDLVTEIWRDSVPPFFKDWWELLFEPDGVVKCYSELAPGVTIELMWGGFGEERGTQGRGEEKLSHKLEAKYPYISWVIKSFFYSIQLNISVVPWSGIRSQIRACLTSF